MMVDTNNERKAYGILRTVTSTAPEGQSTFPGFYFSCNKSKKKTPIR